MDIDYILSKLVLDIDYASLLASISQDGDLDKE